MPSRASATCTSSRALKIRHFTVASVISSESAISLYERPTTSRSSSAIFRSTGSAVDRAPQRVDRLDPLDRLVDHLERRDVVEVDRRQRPALARTQLVEHAVLRHLEEPRRELAAEREARQPLEDAQEHLLRQILGERPVAVRQPQDVVVDRRLVHPHDDGECTFVPVLGLPQYGQIGLWE